MSDWATASAGSVRPGDHVRRGAVELVVTEIQESFLGRDGMIAFIEDSDRQWLKIPAPRDGEIERRRP